MDNKELVKKLEGFEEDAKHKIPPCDLESGDYVQIKLNKADASKLKELLSEVIRQL
ncbi:hypothetical protein [Treponema zioleckii]|uniref:hypothetical protein n=1 Tax=Treponema zioleckii TaxID=331680 RepID=UPI00168B6CE3|nr:hypothetical protein [Treponema zioleckii]